MTKLFYMKTLPKLLLAAIATIGSLCTMAQSQDDMKAMMAYMTPGEVHQMMAKSVGNWNGALTMWMQPGAPPMNMTAECKNEMILGGRYLQSRNTGSFNGMPFEGIGTTAYDNAKKIFINTWIDNMGTGVMYLEGTWDDPSKSIVFKGKMVDPASGKDIQVKQIVKFIDDDTQLMEMYATQNGKEFKTMEIKFTRK
jgi:hypothetical protein